MIKSSPKKPKKMVMKTLPRGRHGLDRVEVLDSQKTRLFAAMLQLVGTKGYAATTVPDVVAEAKTSRNAFYALFKDKEDCCLQLCMAETAAFSEEVMTAAHHASSWEETVALGIHAALQWWQDHPWQARAYMVELQMIGERAAATRMKAYEPFEQMLRLAAGWARASNPTLPPMRASTPHLVIMLITELIAEKVRARQGHRLIELAEELIEIALCLLSGAPSVASKPMTSAKSG